MSLVRVLRFPGGMGSIAREEIRADERRWVLLRLFQYPHNTIWIPKDETEPVVIPIPEELKKAIAPLLTKRTRT